MRSWFKMRIFGRVSAGHSCKEMYETRADGANTVRSTHCQSGENGVSRQSAMELDDKTRRVSGHIFAISFVSCMLVFILGDCVHNKYLNSLTSSFIIHSEVH